MPERTPTDDETLVRSRSTPAGAGVWRNVASAGTSLRAAAGRPDIRRWLLVVFAGVFVVLTVASFRALPEESRDPNLWLVALLVLVTAPLTVLANALEFRQIGAILGHQLPLQHTLRVSLVATIANYLPAPGGVAVRTAALKRAGTTVRSALWVNGIAAVIWLAMTGLVAGTAMLIVGELRKQAVASIAGGATLLVIAALVVWRRDQGAARGRLAWLALVELGVVFVSGARVFLSLRALGEPVSVGAALGISSATVVAAAIGIAPAGLGIRETLAATVAAGLHVPAAAAIAASAVDRVASQVGVAITALVAGVRRDDLVGARAPIAGGAAVVATDEAPPV